VPKQNSQPTVVMQTLSVLHKILARSGGVHESD
jgi:hypothetical protein